MASMREHMQKVHEAASAHHSAMAKSHEQLAKCYGSMGKAAGGDDGKVYRSIANEHEKMCKSNQDASEYHGQAADECMKAHEDSLNKIRPDSISSIPRIDAPAGDFGIRAVPRAGQPPIGTVDKSSIPPQFRHLVTLEDEV